MDSLAEEAVATPMFPRHLHLDFHTSPLIEDVARDFDARAFARQLKEAHVTSVTVFAKCHHGMCYYPTRCGAQHPALKGRDLLGEQIEALHAEGIRCPVYLTVGWEENAAMKQVEWRQLSIDGHSLRAEPRGHDGRVLPGGWHWMNWLHPDYAALIEEHVREVLGGYEVDGLFFDIVSFAPAGGWSPHSYAFREKRQLTAPDAATWDRFKTAAQNSFTSRMTSLIRQQRPDCSIFYNTALHLRTDRHDGIRHRAAQQTHFEVESLPTAHWGYYHFSRTARFVAQLGVPWIGLTGRFHKGWGDFGGIKPSPALEFECFRAQALGGGVGVGDQLHPRGHLDQGAFALIGSVYRELQDAEAFYEGSKAFPQIGVMLAGSSAGDAATTTRSEAGAVLLCEAARRDPLLLDDTSDFSALPAIVLPDSTVMTTHLAQRLKEYYDAGGALIGSFKAGLDASGAFLLDFLAMKFHGESTADTTYWRGRHGEVPSLSADERVIYQRGVEISPRAGARAVVDRVLPYFQRTDATFCSHYQAPPGGDVSPHPAVILGERFAFFADPIFREFREVHSRWIGDTWEHVVAALVGPPPFGPALPPSVQIIPRRRNRDLLLTVLRYLPTTKATLIDIVDERLPLDDVVLTFARPVPAVLAFPENEPLPAIDDTRFRLRGAGRALLSVPGYFSGET